MQNNTEEAAKQNELWDKLMSEWKEVSENLPEERILPYLKSKFILADASKEEPCTKYIVDLAMKETAKDVRLPKCVRDRLVKEEPKGLEELTDEFIENNVPNIYEYAAGEHSEIVVRKITWNCCVDSAKWMRDLILPHLRVANQIPNNEELRNKLRNLVTASWSMGKSDQEKLIDIFIENLSGVSNTQSSEAVEFAEFIHKRYPNAIKNKDSNYEKGLREWQTAFLADEDITLTTSELYTEFLKSKGITPVEKEPCKCLCHISEGVIMHMFPCCEETNKKH